VANLALASVKKTGIKLIDDQHLALLDLIRDFDAAINEHGAKKDLEENFEKLIDYICYHFKEEEGLLIQHDYPDFKAHKKKHDKLIRQALSFQEKYKKGIPNLEVEIMFFLSEWIVSHINKTDMAYVSHITGNEYNNSALLNAKEAVSKADRSNKSVSVKKEKTIMPPDCITGIAEIDNQHRAIMGLINSLDETISKQQAAESKKTLTQLIVAIKTHFSSEEKLLENSNITIDGYKDNNKKFIKKINMFQKMCNDGVGCSETEIAIFLQDWFLRHVKIPIGK
jgi:hemerythrin-like metal-binding protein